MTTQNDQETLYEKNQKFNFLVAWLHSLRYKNIFSVFNRLNALNHGKQINVLDIGCAHAKLFSLLNKRFPIDYIGIEINSEFVETAHSRYAHFPNFKIIQGSAAEQIGNMNQADIVVALEALEHMPESDTISIIENMKSVRPKFFVCSVPVEIGPAIWIKNIGSFVTGYVRHKEYRWSETFWAGMYRLDKLPVHDNEHKGFDWRQVEQIIRENMEIKEIKKFPLGFLPAPFSFSVFMVAEPKF